MAICHEYDMPELFPQPKNIALDGGISELGTDVRLVTNNVLPIQRKAIRSVLTASGVRVVANKKKYIVSAEVKDADSFDLSQVPEDCHSEYYELTVIGSEVHIYTPYQEGTVWAAQTLATIFGIVQKGGKVPNLTIKDWPQMPVRGIFVENKWGTDRMTSHDWFQAIDAISSVKLNTMGMGLYGCWGNCRFSNHNMPTEFLMFQSTLPENEDIYSEQRIRWYDAKADYWKDETAAPYIFQHDFFAEVISYGKERGVNVIPFFNCLGHNTLFPRLRPEISAINEAGEASGTGFCLSTPKTKEFLSGILGEIVEKYYPEGLEYFHVQLDEVYEDYPHPEAAQKKESPWCQCKECSAKETDDLFLEYIIWLATFLRSKGVDKVVLWDDQLSRRTALLGDKFAKAIAGTELEGKLVLHWWSYNNEKLAEHLDPELAEKSGLSSWVAPMSCYYNWSNYVNKLPNIDKMMHFAESNKVRGAVTYGIHDPSHLDHEALLGLYGWESCVVAGPMELALKRWATLHFGEEADTYLEAKEQLTEAANNEKLAICLYYQYTYTNEELKDWPRAYPLEALVRLEEDCKASNEALEKCITTAEKATTGFSKLLENEELTLPIKYAVMSLLADALRCIELAKNFIFLLDLRQKLATATATEEQAGECEKRSEEIKDFMLTFAENKAAHTVPASAQSFTYLCLFMLQLAAELKDAAKAGKNDNLSWTLPENWELPEEN